MASRVYFTDFRCTQACAQEQTRLGKLGRLIVRAGIDDLDVRDKFVAVKIHFGEWGNTAFLRQQYARVVCDHVKARGGMPFLTDCNTLYPGYRRDALHHLDAAYMNGYNPLATGVHTIIADGLRGTEERLVPVEGGEYVRTAKIGSAIADADVLITLTHCKGHMFAGFGGVLKNIGMGCGSKHGKMEMHSDGTPVILADRCVGCGRCARHCAHDGVRVVGGKAVIDEGRCVGCGHCFAYCPNGAIDCKWAEGRQLLNVKTAEYAKAVLQGKPAFHVAFLMDVTPRCDCDPSNDVPMIPDVGMFAGFDPVALDQACVDAANRQPVMPDSAIGGMSCPERHDIFGMAFEGVDWEAGFAHAEKLGIGTRAYELVKVDG